MGRWGYIIITGTHEIKTSLFTFICPCQGKSPGSVYSQQLTYMAENLKKHLSDTSCPRQLLEIDLKSEIDKKRIGTLDITDGRFQLRIERPDSTDAGAGIDRYNCKETWIGT